MESRVAKALENHKNGYNCAQAVACTYSDLVGVDEATMFRMTEGFGAGMGGMECTCGAVSGAIAVAGMSNSQGPENLTTKADTYKLSKEIVNQFKIKNGSVICSELKGLQTKKVLRSCPGCIEDAAQLVEQILFADK